MGAAYKAPERRRSASLLIKLRPVERLAVEQAAERDQVSMSSVARRAILRDLKARQAKESDR